MTRTTSRIAAMTVVLGGGLTLPAGPAAAQKMETCTEVSTEQIAGLFDRWNASLATGRAEAVTGHYAPDAVLLATVSNMPRTSHALINDYFVHFLEKKPRGRIDTRTIRIGCNIAADVGTYTFTLTDPKSGQISNVAARYSYIYERRDGLWLIVHHHSSAMPEKPVTATVGAHAAAAPRTIRPKPRREPANDTTVTGYKPGGWNGTSPTFN